MIIRSYSPEKVSNTSIMRLEPSSSAGLGGCGPAGNSFKLGNDSTGVSMALSFIPWVRIVLVP